MTATSSPIALPGVKFTAQAPQDVLDDLHDRLRRTRFPDRQAGADWQTGTPLGYAQRLRSFWLDGFDWRAWEARINGFEQRIVEIDGEHIHVLVEQGSGDHPMPLLLTNGWPGSFLEFLDVIGPLAHPERHGGRIEDAFTVVIPSLPGYGYAPPPAQPISPRRIAELWSKLARETFGFDRYVAYGSDWGSLVTTLLAEAYPAGLAAIMLTSPGRIPYMGEGAPPLSAAELAWQGRCAANNAREGGYVALQATKPQSLAYGHYDSPMALACWTVEKFQAWTIPGTPDDPPMPMDDLVANVMLYWLNGALAPMWLYLAMGEIAQPAATNRRVTVPAGFLFGADDLMPPAPREWLERSFDVLRLTEAKGGGHFPGLEDPAFLVAELREVFAGVR